MCRRLRLVALHTVHIQNGLFLSDHHVSLIRLFHIQSVRNQMRNGQVIEIRISKEAKRAWDEYYNQRERRDVLLRVRNSQISGQIGENQGCLLNYGGARRVRDLLRSTTCCQSISSTYTISFITIQYGVAYQLLIFNLQLLCIV